MIPLCSKLQLSRRTIIASAAFLMVFLPYSRAGLAQTAQKYHVGAWYFTLWGSQGITSMQAANAQSTYGGLPDPWGGIREYNEGNGAVAPTSPAFGTPANYASRKPLQGFYDLSDQSTVDAQIQMAASEGIEFFSFYWYFDGSSGAENPISSVVQKFFDSTQSNKMGFVLAPIMGGGASTISLSAWQSTVVPKLVNYMSKTSYYKINGRPVLVDFQWPFLNSAETSSGIDILRNAVQQKLGVTPYIVYTLSGANTFNDMYYQSTNTSLDAFTCFVGPINGNPESYQAYISSYMPWMASQYTNPQSGIDQKITYMPCGSIGQDARPWWQVGWGPWVYPTISSRPYNVGVNVDLWSQHLQQIKNLIDSQSLTTMNVVFLYAWNEWGESAMQIEPSALYGYQYADAIRQVFKLIPRSPRPIVSVSASSP